MKIEIGKDNPILRKKTKEIEKITPQIEEVISDMSEILESDFNNVGLAAPQIGQSIQLILFKSFLNSKPFALINPKLKKKSFGKESMKESCLSLPGFSISVKRYKKITVEGLNAGEELIRIEAKGFLARVIQHEMDHLNGILISDY